MTGVRESMADAAALLLAEQGYQATSFSEVLAASGAPRGSIYHHFPGGKDQLVAVAIDRQAARAIGGLDRLEGRSPAGIVDGFMHWWRGRLVGTDFAVGCSLLGLAASTGPGGLRDDAGTLFRRWVERLAELFTSAGVAEPDALSFATELLAAAEGVVLIARVQRSLVPFDLVAARLRAEAELLQRKDLS